MAETMTVRIRNLKGHLREVELTDNGRFATPGSALEQQLVTTATGNVLIRKFVPLAAGRARPHLYDCLDREIQAGARLGQMYGGSCPPELPDLVAYDMDAEEPFALLRPYEGDPVGDSVLSRIAGDEDAGERFQRSLIRAVELTGRAGVVHGEVSLRHLRWNWNGKHVQLVDFEAARCAPLRRSNGAGPGRVDVREDLAPAGMIIRRVALGTSATGSPADHSRDPDHLRALLEDVFEQQPGRRPYAFELLGRLGDDTKLPRTEDPEAELHEGWREFDRLTTPQTGTPPAPKQRGDNRRRGWWFGLMTLTVLAAMGVSAR